MLLFLIALMLLKLLLLVRVVVVYVNRVEVVRFPVLLRSLDALHLLVDALLVVVQVHVAVGDDVEVAHSEFVRFLHGLLLLLLRGALLRRVEVVLLEGHVADYVVVHHRFRAGLLVADRVLLHWEIRMRFKSCAVSPLT